VPQERWVGRWEDATPQSISADCGWCGRAVEMNRTGPPVELERTEYFTSAEDVTVGAPYVCPRDECHCPSLVFIEFYEQYGDTWAHRVVGQFPWGRAQPMEGLPEAIDNVRREAWSCFHGGAYRAALVMGRAAVQRAVRTLGAEGRDLFHEIDNLRANGTITEELKDWAHGVRLEAREAAHPEELGEVSKEDAERSLRFADAFLQYAVALPEQARQQREQQS
jgi:hypothetical protein